MIGSLANRGALDGVDVFPNLGYQKDAFLEPSLVSNNFPLLPSATIPTINATALSSPCPPTTCNSNNCSNPLMCPQSWRGSPASLQLSQSSYSCPFFAMPSRCSPLKFVVAGASQTSAELRSLPQSSPVFSGVLQSAGVPPCPPELLLLPRSPFPSEFFGDSSRSFPCLPRAFLLSPIMLLLHHSFAVP